MRIDAESIPDGHRLMSEWAAGGDCPYTGLKYDRIARFCEKRKHWTPGRPPSLWHIWERLAQEKDVKISTGRED